MDPESSERSYKYDLGIDLLILLGVAINVYFIVDVATEGALTASVLEGWSKAVHRFGVWYGVQADKVRVVNTAANIAELGLD